MACTCEPMVSQEAEIEESSRSRTSLPAGQSGAEARETQNKTKRNQVKEENWLGKVSLWPPVQFWGKWFHMQSQHKENYIYIYTNTYSSKCKWEFWEDFNPCFTPTPLKDLDALPVCWPAELSDSLFPLPFIKASLVYPASISFVAAHILKVSVIISTVHTVNAKCQRQDQAPKLSLSGSSCSAF